MITLTQAVGLVPFSDTTLRRAIARGELEAWQPRRSGKVVMWRSAVLAWATRRPANTEAAGADERRATRRRGSTQLPAPIALSDIV